MIESSKDSLLTPSLGTIVWHLKWCKLPRTKSTRCKCSVWPWRSWTFGSNWKEHRNKKDTMWHMRKFTFVFMSFWASLCEFCVSCFGLLVISKLSSQQVMQVLVVLHTENKSKREDATAGSETRALTHWKRERKKDTPNEQWESE